MMILCRCGREYDTPDRAVNPCRACEKPQATWTVAPLLTNPRQWLAMRVFPDGTVNQLGPCPRDTEEAARSDGMASKLPEYQPPTHCAGCGCDVPRGQRFCGECGYR